MAAIAIKLKDGIQERVKQLAKKRDRSTHWILCEAVNNYLEQEEFIEELKQEAIKSWQHYQETGLHITGDECLQWLHTWGTDKPQEIPKCHV